jgi:hypothetical protein
MVRATIPMRNLDASESLIMIKLHRKTRKVTTGTISDTAILVGVAAKISNRRLFLLGTCAI